MGPLRGIKNLPENFLVMNGDILTDLNFNKLYRIHIENKNLFTISSYKRKELIDYGLLETNKKNNLAKFVEKPHKIYQVSMGIYIIRKIYSNIFPIINFMDLII